MSTDAIELWLVDLERCCEPLEALERVVPRLSADDLERAAAINDARERRHRLAAYSALRVLLERVAGAGVRREPLIRMPGYRPRLTSGRPEFSLSHIDGLAMVGISPSQPIGVDLERLRAVRMTPHRVAEIIAIARGLSDKIIPPGGPERTFIQAWSRLEAFCKARGLGISQTLADIGVRSTRSQLSAAEIEARARKLARDANIEITDLYPQPGVYGAAGTARGFSLGQPRLFPVDQGSIERLASGQA